MIKTVTSLAGVYLNTLAHILPKTAAEQGFKLFCRPFRAPLKDYHKKFLNTADQFSFEHDGVVIQGYRWGSGEKKILFVHGWQSHSFRWKVYVDSLSKNDYTLYAIDAPGHGLSGGSFLTVPYYSAVIQQLIGSLGTIHTLVGHSLGCFAALHAFYEQPNLPVDKLVLMAPPGEASDFMLFYKNTLKLSDKVIDLIKIHFEKVIKKPITFFVTPVFAKNVSIPGIIIHDKTDVETPYKYAELISMQWPQSKLITTEGLGHNLKSAEVVKEIINYIHNPTWQPAMEVDKD